MTAIYEKIEKLKRKDNLKRLFKSAAWLFSPRYRYKHRNPPVPMSVLMKYRIENVLRFCEYADIGLDEFFRIARTKKCGGNFKNYNNEKDFYSDWQKEDTALNIFNQLLMYQEYFAYAFNHFRDKKINYCDYGCGSALNSLCLYSVASFNQMHLYDVENASSEYLKSYINKYDLKNVRWYNASDNAVEEEFYDLIMCSDVLEHLKEPSKILNKLYKMLKPGGYLILAAPFEFRNNDEHIIDAPIDFYNGDGFGFLKKNFEEVYHFNNNLHISGVYKKKAELKK